MSTVVIARAKGENGFQDMESGQYISAKEYVAAPKTGYLESMANHGKAEIKKDLKISWEEYIQKYREANFVHSDALKAIEAAGDPEPKPEAKPLQEALKDEPVKPQGKNTSKASAEKE